MIPSRAAHHVAFVEVTAPLPLAKPFVLGLGQWAEQHLIVFGFTPIASGKSTRRVVLLGDETHRRMRVGVQIDGVEDLTHIAAVEGQVAPSGPGSFFKLGRSVEGERIRVLDVRLVLQHVLGAN